MRTFTQIKKSHWLNLIAKWVLLPFLVACVCGDGTRQMGEDCDDGNEITEACAYGEESCTVCNFKCRSRVGVTSYCGDGRVDGSNGEMCDDGDQAQDPCPYGDTSCTVCSGSCREVPGETSFCGDGRIDEVEGEQCDNGSQNGQACAPGDTNCVPCSSNCTLETVDTCGDGVVDSQNGEGCDDGNRTTELCAYGESSCTVCNAACQSIAGQTQRCGDGIEQSAFEQCDDGNTVTESCGYGDNDCTICDADCNEVNGVERYCGDGVVEPNQGEECDDGNSITESCDYGVSSCTVCSNTCENVAGATRRCGDGVVDAGYEQCDDGNDIDTDACPNSCRFTNCGDGVVQAGEGCDDSNNLTESCAYGETSCIVCNANCQNESGATSYCGDRQTDSGNGETCDDGNAVDTDSCTNACKDAVCGDNIVQAGRELCDDGNTETEACDYGEESCTVCGPACVPVPGASVSYCGDGVVQGNEGESCDDGNTETESCAYGAASCTVCASDCQSGPGGVSYCGDGTIDGEDGETCDDSNNATEDCAYGLESCTVCTAGCTQGAGNPAYCGDGVVQADKGEACDDGNDDATDGCVSCQVVSCGDGVLQDGEACDDGNSVTEDCAYGEESCTVCANSCQFGPGLVSYCGDGVRDDANGEDCDDGNSVIESCPYGETSCKACDQGCNAVDGYTSFCGDGILDWTDGEQCDDGNNDDGDYCEGSCLRTTGWCGDGLVQLNEVCDDANTDDGDYCASDCQLRTGKCGDGVLQLIEACDDGNPVDGDYCSSNCTEPTGSCGDGEVQANEACDDGNEVDGDYCSATCQSVTGTCGDGITQANELCDDGNTATGDYCSSDCLAVTGRCGDGVVQLGEACDDGNSADNDLCSADCSQAAGNVAPVINDLQEPSVAANGCLVLRVGATDLNGDALTYSLYTGPEGASIDPSSGVLTYFPNETQVGTQYLEVDVMDGGLTATRILAVTVTPVESSDRVAPRVQLRLPTQALPSSTVTVEAVVGDSAGVASVEFLMGSQVALTLNAPPYVYTFQTLSAAGPIMPLSVRATDTAGNSRTVSGRVSVVEALSTDLPAVTALRAPTSMVAGSSAIIGVDASSASGIASVSFVKDGVTLAESTVPPFGAQLTIPNDAALGAWPLTIVVTDFAGNTLSQVESLNVVNQIEAIEPPKPVFVAPDRSLPGRDVPFELEAASAVQVSVSVEGMLVDEDYSGALSGSFGLSSSRQVGETVRLEGTITYSDGAVAESYACVELVDRLGGIARGSVLDDGHGRGLEGVSLSFTDELGQVTHASSDSNGDYQLELVAGEYRLSASLDDYTLLHRSLTVRPDAVTRIPDLRLTPVGEPTTIPGIGASTLSAGAWTISVPSAAMGRFTELSVTDIGAQAMPAVAPLGYGVVAAVQLGELEGLSTGSFTLAVEAENEPRLLLAQYDATTAQWLKLSSVASGSAYTATVASTGLCALLRPDSSPLAPVAVDVGEALEAVAAASLPSTVEGELLPASAALSVSLIDTQPSVSVDATLQAAEGVSSGAVVQLEVSESYSFVDGSDLTPQPVLRDVTLSQAVGEGVARGSLNLSPSQPLDPSAFTGGTISIRGVAGQGATINGLVDTQAGQLEAGGHVFIYEAGTFGDVGTLAIRVLSEPDAVESEAGLFDVMGGFVLEGLAPSSALELVYHAPGEAIDAEHALVRRVRDGNRTAFALVDLGTLDGAKVRFDGAYDGVTLPGLRALGDYRILRLRAPWRLVSGTVVFGTADLEDAWVVGQANDWPIVGAATTIADRFALLVHPNVAEITATSLSRGFQATATLDAGTTPSQHTLTLVPSPPTLLSSSPAQGATGAPIAGSLALTFSQRLADGELPADALTLHGPSGSLSATLSRLGDGKTVLLKPDVALSDLTVYTVRGGAGITDIYGQALAVPDGSTDIELLSFTTGDFTPPQVQQPDGIIVSIPDEGQSTAVGGPGSVDAGTLVVFRNNTTGELVTVEANEDGSFSVTGNAELGDDIDLLFIDASGNETEFDPENFENLDGTKLVDRRGATVRGPDETALEIPADAFIGEVQVAVKTLDEADRDTSLPASVTEVAALTLSFRGDESTAAEEMDLSGPVDPSLGLTDGEQLLVFRETYYAGAIYLHLVEEAIVSGDRYETQSPPFEGITEAGDYLITTSEGVTLGTGEIPGEQGLSGYVLVRAETLTTYARWETGKPFVFVVPTGESFVFDVLDREGGFLYTTEAQNATWANGLAHTETLEAVYRSGYFGFNLVGSSPTDQALDVGVHASIYLRFSDGISTEEPVEICVRRASTPGYFQECVPTRRTLQHDLDDRLSVVELRPLAVNGLEPETPYVVDILSVTSVHAQRITFEPEAFGWTTGMAPDPTDASDVGDDPVDPEDPEVPGNSDGDGIPDELYVDAWDQIETDISGPFEIAGGTPTPNLGLNETAEMFVESYSGASADVIEIDDAVRITFTHPVNAFDPALSLCLRPQPWPDAPTGTTEACLAGSFELIEDDFGSFNTLEFVGDWRLEYGRTYELTLNHVSSIGGSVIENTTPSMVFHTFRPRLLDSDRLTSQVWDLEVTGMRNLLMGLGTRSDLNGNAADDESGVQVVDIRVPDSISLREHRVIGGLQTDLHVRRDGTFLVLGSSWYRSSQLKAYGLNGADQITGPLWNQKLTPDAALAEPASLEMGVDGIYDDNDIIHGAFPTAIPEVPDVQYDPGHRDLIGNIVRTYRNHEGRLCSDEENQGTCSSRTECRWDVDECVLSRQRINTDDHWINFIGAPWSLDTMDADLVDTTCRDLVEESECRAVFECGWDEAELLCYIEEGADEHMYVATLGVGIQHVTRTVKESEPLSAHQVDFWSCPGCGTVATFEGKVLAGDGNNLYVLNPDLSIVEVHPQIDAQRIFVAEDFAIQQHGTFDMAFVVQPGGKVSLLTLKAPEVGPEGAGNTMPEARFMEVGEFWLPPPTNEARDEDAPFVSIKDMAFDPSRFLAYASTLDTLYTIDLTQLVTDYCSTEDYQGLYPVVASTPLFNEPTYTQLEYTQIEISADGKHLYVADTPSNHPDSSMSSGPHLLSIALSVEGEGTPEVHPSLLSEARGQIATCERMVFGRKFLEDSQRFLDQYEVQLDANRQELMLMSEIMLELSYQSMIEPYDALATYNAYVDSVAARNAQTNAHISAGVAFAGEVVNGALDVLPIVGDVKGMLEVLTGDNYVTGETLGSFERYLGAGLMLIPVVGKYVVKIGAKALKVGKDISLRVADSAVTVARATSAATTRNIARLARSSRGLIRNRLKKLRDAIADAEDDIRNRMGRTNLPCPELAMIPVWPSHQTPVQRSLDSVLEAFVPSAYADQPACDLPGAEAGEILAKREELFDPNGRFVTSVEAPEARGITQTNHEGLKEFAANNQKIMLVRDSNPAAVRWIKEQEARTVSISDVHQNITGFSAKPMKCKAKSITDENSRYHGLVAVDRSSPRMAEALGYENPDELLTWLEDPDRYVAELSQYDQKYRAYVDDLKRDGFIVDPSPPNLVLDENGNALFADMDLHGYYDMDGKNAWPQGDDEELLEKLNNAVKGDRGSDMVKHGPQDCWPERNNSDVAKSNKGPQVGDGKSITAYIPDPDSPGGVKVLKIDNPTDFKALYVALGIDWNAAYGINALKDFCL